MEISDVQVVIIKEKQACSHIFWNFENILSILFPRRADPKQYIQWLFATLILFLPPPPLTHTSSR